MNKREMFEQGWILIFTFFSVTFVNIPGCLLTAQIAGLFAQPMWIYKTYQLKQWGMFILSIWFFFTWSFGIYFSLTAL
jgi:hypothetical protein